MSRPVRSCRSLRTLAGWYGIPGLLLTLCVTTTAHAAPPHEYLIGYRSQEPAGSSARVLGDKSRPAPARLTRALGSRVVSELREINVVHIRGELDAEAIRALEASGNVEYIEPVHPLRIMAQPNELLYRLLVEWGHNNVGQYGGRLDVDIDAPEAWNITTGSPNMVVGVIDTGILYTHPDLQANTWRNPGEVAVNGIDDDGNGFIDDVHGYDFHNEDGDPLDDNFHGTHVAGIIGAVGNNNRGVVGVNWNVKLMGLKILDNMGAGTTADAARAIDYAVAMARRGVNLRVLNASFGGGDESEAMRRAIQAARNEGILFVAAAGNDGADNDQAPIFPASYPLDNVIAVASVNWKGALSSFSNYGRTSVDLAAPGSHIWSTFLFDQYFFFDGTSMAAPQVSGVAALLFANQPGLTPAAARSRLLATAKRLTALEGRLAVPGIVSAYNALINRPGQTIDTGPPGTTAAESSNLLLTVAKTIFSIIDTDFDGVFDQQELIDGTSATDRGSFKFRLTSPAFTKYNTFFGQWNFLELISSGGEPVDAKVTVFDITGREITSVRLTIQPGEQRDLNIHDLVGRPDTYGLVRIDFNDDSSARLSGRMSNYLPDPAGGYSFAFARELRNPVRGATFATGNSYDPAGTGFVVPNWLEVLNLESVARDFSVRLYDQGGALVHAEEITVPPLGELDLPAGHQFGQGVYLAEIRPHRSSAKYLAAVTRYSPSGPASYNFAFSLDAKAGTGELQLMPITNQSGGCWRQSNWVEVVNTSSRQTEAGLVLRRKDGRIVLEERFTLAPKAQRHLFAAGVLPAGDVGSAELLGSAAETLLAQSLVYYLDCGHGGLQTAYVSPSQVPQSGDLAGSVNTFLGIRNLFTIVSASDGVGRGGVRALGDEIVIDNPFITGDEAAVQLDVNDRLPPDTYRLLRLRPGAANRMIAQNLRFREVAGVADFAMPTAVR